MDSKRFPILAVIVVVAIIIAAVLLGRRAPESEGSLVGAPVLPGLAERLNDVERLRFVRAGAEEPLTVERREHGWVVSERGGYPADPSKVRLSLLNLGESKLLETKTANPDRYGQLGVQDIDADGATGTRIEIDGEGFEHRLIVGNQASGEGTYVRRAGEAQSLLATGNLVPDPTVAPWLERTITDIPSSRIRELELAKNEARPLRVYKESADDANFTVADLPRGREMMSPYVANGLASMLAGLNLKDVAQDREDAHGDLPLHRATYRMFDGIEIQLQGWQEAESPEGGAGDGHIRLTAHLDEERAREHIHAELQAEQEALRAAAEAERAAHADPEDAAGDDAASDAGEAQADAELPSIDFEARSSERMAELQREVDEINARVSGWLYRIPAYKFANISKSLDDMLKPVE